jgi:hypothetical protein
VALMPNALAALYSYGDGLKRKMNRLISDPAGTIDLGARRFNEDQNALQNLFANAFPMGGDKTVLNSPQQVAQFQGEATDKALETYGGLMGATVWHGSPHTFNKFDSGKIGTGEGAQAYGHGLYLAESPKVADAYRTQLATNVEVGGKPFYNGYSGKKVGATGLGEVDDYLMATLGDTNQARKMLLSDARSMRKDNPAAAKEYQQVMADLRQVRSTVKATNDGSLYKVDLPDEHIAKMLDWDKPLSQQAPGVQAAVKQVVPPFDANMANAITQKIEDASMLARTAADPATRKAAAQEHARLVNSLRTRQPEVEGKSLMSYLGSPVQASQRLREAGIPGVRYLDGGSRGAGGGTSNYVVFPGNENLLQILERNGQAIK